MKKPSIDDILIQNLLSITEEQNERPTTLDGWGNFPSQTLPSMFNHGNIYHYLVESLLRIELEHDNMGDEIGAEATAIPFRKGRQLLDSGFVEDIQDAVDDESYYLRAHVHHSMKKELPLLVTINISNK